MKIAVLLGGLRFDSQRRIINGIMDRAEKDGTDVYVFTCDAWTYSTSQYKNGETSIFKLPDFKSYDGIILHGDTIYDAQVMNQVADEIGRSKVPCVSLNVRYPGMFYLGMENANGIYEIVHHLIHVHHAHRLHFISGPRGNADAEGRLQAFKNALTDNGMSVAEACIYYGDYHSDSGRDAVEYFLQLKADFPDAIVAANDEMALGAFYALREKGYDVPGQVMLTGYDNALTGKNNYPRITTVRRPEFELGQGAYDMLKLYLAGQPVEEKDLLCYPVYRESCGCRDTEQEDSRALRELREMFVRERMHVTGYSEIIKSASADFTGVETFEDFLDKLRRYILMIDPEEFYLCLCIVSGESEKEDVTPQIKPMMDIPDMAFYSPEMCVPIIYRYGEFSEYGRFPLEELLPRKYTEGRSGVLYTVVPIHYQERCYGYCVLGRSRLMIDSGLFHLFVMNINNALENIRKQNLLNAMVERLNHIWVYDTLTGVFNRAGFYTFAPNIIKEACGKGNDLFVLFLDMDNLKEINDKYGHDQGDTAIKAMAGILSQAHRHGELLMRYGGDEFVVLAQGYTGEDAGKYIQQIRAAIGKYNTEFDYPYLLEASMGYSIVRPSEGMDLEELIENADREMYKEKKEKRKNKDKK